MRVKLPTWWLLAVLNVLCVLCALSFGLYQWETKYVPAHRAAPLTRSYLAPAPPDDLWFPALLFCNMMNDVGISASDITGLNGCFADESQRCPFGPVPRQLLHLNHSRDGHYKANCLFFNRTQVPPGPRAFALLLQIMDENTTAAQIKSSIYNSATAILIMKPANPTVADLQEMLIDSFVASSVSCAPSKTVCRVGMLFSAAAENVLAVQKQRAIAIDGSETPGLTILTPTVTMLNPVFAGGFLGGVPATNMSMVTLSWNSAIVRVSVDYWSVTWSDCVSASLSILGIRGGIPVVIAAVEYVKRRWKQKRRPASTSKAMEPLTVIGSMDV